jgi:hypothetical protein
MMSLRRIDASLARLGRRRVPVDGDGNCFFRAVLVSMGQSPAHHTMLRQAAVKFLNDQVAYNLIDITHFLDGESVNAWSMRMLRDGEWCDHAAVHAVSLMLGRPIMLVTPEGSFCAGGTLTPNDLPIYLSYIPNLHYDGTTTDVVAAPPPVPASAAASEAVTLAVPVHVAAAAPTIVPVSVGVVAPASAPTTVGAPVPEAVPAAMAPAMPVPAICTVSVPTWSPSVHQDICRPGAAARFIQYKTCVASYE